jgi:hypothetical protein
MDNSLTNGYHDASDTGSSKMGAPTGFINSLAGGGGAVAGQSTLSRKSGKEKVALI